MSSKNPTKWSELKIGQKFIIVRNSHSYNYPIGKVLTLKRDGCESTHDGLQLRDIAKEVSDGNTVVIGDVELAPHTVAQYKEEIAELNSKIKDLEIRVKFCEETGCEEFDQDEFAIYQALDVLDGVGTRQEKAKALAELLKCK